MKLIVKELQKKFDKKEVLKNLNFTFEKGKIYGLLGRNGAGKTTFFNCINEDLDICHIRYFFDVQSLSDTDRKYIHSYFSFFDLCRSSFKYLHV